MIVEAGGPAAGTRLLPASVPLRFFLAATVFHALAWMLIAVAAEDVAAFAGGLGAPLAALHLITLGVLTTVVMGAMFQLMPVATRLPAGPAWPASMIFLLQVAGVAVLITGMLLGAVRAMAIGAILCASALAAFAVASVAVLRLASKLNLLLVHLWCAFAALAALTVLAVALVFDYTHGFLADHAQTAALHMSLAIYGFMGLLTLGLSHVLLPMFSLAPAPSQEHGRATLGLTALALALGLSGLGLRFDELTAAGLLTGLIAAASHIAGVEASLRKRMRKRLGTPFLLVRIGHAGLLLNLLLGLLLVLDVPIANGAGLFVWVALAGWLLTFMLGILQKIVPFLVSMHLARAKAPMTPGAALGPRGALRLHTVCHLLALTAVGAGLWLQWGALIQIGAGAGTLGALAFAWFAFAVAARVLPLLPSGSAAARTATH